MHGSVQSMMGEKRWKREEKEERGEKTHKREERREESGPHVSYGRHVSS